jgi:FLVCR family MFS transporter
MGAYMSVMVNQLSPLGYSDQQIGYMGLASVVAQCIMSMLFGYISDHLRHKMKLTILILLSVSTGGFVWLMLMCSHHLPQTETYLYMAIIIATSAAYSCCPLFFEMTVELAYPVNEGSVAGFLTAMNNLVGMIFLLLFFIPTLTTGSCMWMSYTLVASTLLAIPATALIKERYNRSNVDEVALNVNS